MRRGCALVALSVGLSACSLLNAVDPARIAAERCDDGVDNDDDGRADCHDRACDDAPACALEGSLDTCTDGRDNDANGQFDCQDAACKSWPVCSEAGGAACADGVDNDKDGATDCDDALCALEPRCVLAARWEPAPLCPPLREGAAFTDEFDTIDPARWSTFSTGARDRPRIVDGGLDPNGVDNFWSSGVSSRALIGTGRLQPFRVSADVSAQTGCDVRGPSGATCLIRISVDTRDVWGDGLPFGRELMSMHLQVERDPDGGPSTLLVIAQYHTDPAVPPVGVAHLPWVAGEVYRATMALDRDTGEVVFTVGEVEIGRASMLAREPLGRVVLQSQLDRLRGPGAMVARRLEVEVEPETAAPGCLGRSAGASLLPTAYCDPAAFYDTGFDAPVVASVPGRGYVMLFVGSYAFNRQSVGQAVSDDGRAFTHVTPAPTEVDRESVLARSAPFEVARARGLLVDAEQGRLEAWHLRSNPQGPEGAWMSVASLDEPTRWSRVGALTATAALPYDHQIQSAGDASMVRVGGRYYAFYLGASPGRRPSVFALTSNDGLVFRALSREPVLEPSRDGFDVDGIRAVSVVPFGGGFLLAYVGTAFAGGSAIGLAYSADGTHFDKHPDNPLVVSEPTHVSALGFRGLSLAVEGSTLRIWYVGDSEGVVCEPPGVGVPTRSKVGLAELTAVDRVRAR